MKLPSKISIKSSASNATLKLWKALWDIRLQIRTTWKHVKIQWRTSIRNSWNTQAGSFEAVSHQPIGLLVYKRQGWYLESIRIKVQKCLGKLLKKQKIMQLIFPSKWVFHLPTYGSVKSSWCLTAKMYNCNTNWGPSWMKASINPK